MALGLALLAGLLAPPAAWGQWRVGVDFGLVGFHGGAGSLNSNGVDTTLTPSGPVRYGVQAAAGLGRWEIGLGIHTAPTGVSATVDFISFVDHTGLRVWAFEPTLGRRLLGTPESSQLWLEAGPAINVWLPAGEDPRTRIGATAAIGVRQHATARLSTNIRAHASLGPSPFIASDLRPGLVLKSLWEFGLSFGLDFRL